MLKTIAAAPVATLIFISGSALSPRADEVDLALRAVTVMDKLEEGVDFQTVQTGGGPTQSMQDMVCFVATSLRCTDQNMVCKFLPVGAFCTSCDGAGGMFIATNVFCIPSPGDTCLVNPAGQTSCGKQRRSRCNGTTAPGMCSSVATASTSDCHVKECT